MTRPKGHKVLCSTTLICLFGVLAAVHLHGNLSLIAYHQVLKGGMPLQDRIGAKSLSHHLLVSVCVWEGGGGKFISPLHGKCITPCPRINDEMNIQQYN